MVSYRNLNTRFSKFALPILRFGLAFVFLWFGSSQLRNPSEWISFLPNWTSVLPISQIQIIYFNGFFEIAGAIMLILGAYTNIVALVLSFHLFSIAFSIGFNSIAVRDIGLAVATLALALLGAGGFSVDAFTRKSNYEF